MSTAAIQRQRYFVTWDDVFTSVDASDEDDARRQALPDFADYGATEQDLTEFTVEVVSQ